MQRRLFLLGFFAFPLTQKRDMRKIVTEISRHDKQYNEIEALLVKRAQYFTPETDATIKGWARKEAELSHKVGDLWQEFADL